MSVQVVQHDPELLRFRVSGIRQPAHLMGEVGHGATPPVAATCLQPADGSQVMNKFRVPLRWHS